MKYSNLFPVIIFITLSFFFLHRNVFASQIVMVSKVQISIFEEYLDAFKKDNGRFPTQAEGLLILFKNINELTTWKGPYIPKPICRDPWGNSYLYIIPAKYGNKSYDLYSFGINGEDDHGAKDDITNWSDIDWEYYGGFSDLEKIFVSVVVLIIFMFSTLLICRIKKPSIQEKSLRFAVWSFLSMLSLLILLIMKGTRHGSLSYYEAIIGGFLLSNWVGFSLFGIALAIIALIKYNINIKQICAIVICLGPWIVIGTIAAIV